MRMVECCDRTLPPVCNMCTIERLDADIAPGGAGCSFTEAEGCINRIKNPTESTRFMMCYCFSELNVFYMVQDGDAGSSRNLYRSQS